MVDPSGGAENRVVAGLADVVRTTAQRARGSPLDQYLPWYIVRLCGVLSEKFTESLNSGAGIACVASEEGSHEKHKTARKGFALSRCVLWLSNAGGGTHDIREFWNRCPPSEISS